MLRRKDYFTLHLYLAIFPIVSVAAAVILSDISRCKRSIGVTRNVTMEVRGGGGGVAVPGADDNGAH
jgi:hypothetical protein